MNSRTESEPGLAKRIHWDRHEVAPALDLLEKDHENHLGHLTRILNDYHHADHDSSYYDLLCGEWLLTFSHALYAAYLHVTRGFPHAEWSHEIPAFSDYGHFQTYVVEKADFSEQLTAHVAEALGNGERHSITFGGSTILVGGGGRSGWGRHMRAWKGSIFSTFSKRNAPFVFCRPHLNGCGRLEWGAALWSWRKWAREESLDQPVEVTVKVDTAWRKKMAKASPGESFGELLCQMLPLYMPAAYLEAFGSLRNQAHALDIQRPQAIYTSNSLYGHTVFKMLAADWRLDGTKILNHQHGGNYGLDRIHAIERFETRVSDRFYTLGWTGASPKQKILPGALSPKWKAGKHRKGRILLNCISYPDNIYRIHFQPMPGTIETMSSQMAAFVTETKGLEVVTLRPSPKEYGTSAAEMLQKIDGSILIDNLSIPGIRSYANYDVVVHAYLGTSWLETLALDIPTICFYDPETYAFREESLELIRALSRVGILHESGRAAAKFALSVIRHPREWWEKPDVQSARVAFVERYASFTADWPGVWEREFMNWIN